MQTIEAKTAFFDLDWILHEHLLHESLRRETNSLKGFPVIEKSPVMGNVKHHPGGYYGTANKGKHYLLADCTVCWPIVSFCLPSPATQLFFTVQSRSELSWRHAKALPEFFREVARIGSSNAIPDLFDSQTSRFQQPSRVFHFDLTGILSHCLARLPLERDREPGGCEVYLARQFVARDWPVNIFLEVPNNSLYFVIHGECLLLQSERSFAVREPSRGRSWPRCLSIRWDKAHGAALLR